MAFFIDGPEAKIVRTGNTSVELRLSSGEIFSDLEVRRLFPLSDLTHYITLLDSSQNEKALVRDLSRLDADSRTALEACLAEYYMIPKITKMIRITLKFDVLTWTCQTDHGLRSFRIRNRYSDIKRLDDGRILIRDSNDNRYEIENVDALDKKSRRMLVTEL